MKKVAILFDRDNDWLADQIPKNLAENDNFEVSFHYEEQEVRGFDIVFVLGYTHILRGDVLKKNRLLLVVHESDLPRGRGFSPVQWQILEGRNEITVCLLEVSAAADAGHIYARMNLKFNGSELYQEIRKKQAEVTYELVLNFLSDYPKVTKTAQVGRPTYYRRRRAIDSQLDIDATLKSQFNLLRICHNESWPAFFELGGVRYTLRIEKSPDQPS